MTSQPSLIGEEYTNMATPWEAREGERKSFILTEQPNEALMGVMLYYNISTMSTFSGQYPSSLRWHPFWESWENPDWILRILTLTRGASRPSVQNTSYCFAYNCASKNYTGSTLVKHIYRIYTSQSNISTPIYGYHLRFSAAAPLSLTWRVL